MTVRNRWEENGSKDQNQVSHIQEGGSWRVADGKGEERTVGGEGGVVFSSNQDISP